ncbi:MAG TPA: hypothetical protein DCW90_11250 [Lachnospiraceae bacterium]|nr:hypothetical protein [Lachnospiraceae bacterium]
MHIKIFDCDIFIDSHEVSIQDKHSGSGWSCESQPIPTYAVKDVIEGHLVPNIYLHRYIEELLKKPINPNAVS